MTTRTAGSTRTSTRRITARLTLLLTSVVLSAVALTVGTGAAQAAEPVGCDYGSGGPNAGTLCWLDMSSYNDTLARSANGQPMTIGLPGGYTASFAVTARAVAGRTFAPVEHRSGPLETRFAFGQTAYVGVSGHPILYSVDAGNDNGVTLALNDITVTDASGEPVTGYSFVIADAENNIADENFTWTSDQPLSQLAVVNPSASAGCTLPLTGVGTTTVTCTGKGGGGGPYNGVVVSADTPSNIALTMTTFARSGIAFAIQTSKITLNKAVSNRVADGDSFDVSVTSPEGTTAGDASTGTADAATTGEVTVLPRTNGAVYTLAETATPGSGTDLGAYTQSWSCSNAAASSDTSLPSGSGTSKELSPQAGDDITCTLTNSGPPIVETPMLDAESIGWITLTTLLAAGAVLVVRRRRTTA